MLHQAVGVVSTAALHGAASALCGPRGNARGTPNGGGEDHRVYCLGTGFQVSHVGFGGGGIGQVWGPTTEAESVRAIHRGLELGVNFFDVAPAYGHGTAEEVLGRALQGRQEPGVVVTCERDRRTAGVCRPAPDSATASHTSAGTLRPGFPR
jgi:Aldo/keto reductase family